MHCATAPRHTTPCSIHTRTRRHHISRWTPTWSSQGRAAQPALAAAAAAGPVTAVTVAITNPEGPPFESSFSVPQGAQVYTVSLKKPLGLTLTEAPPGVLVESVVAGGHAAAAGVRPGDLLLATTARAQGPSSAGTQLVLVKAAGLPFKTVTAALRSNTCAQCSISLVLQHTPPPADH